MASFSEFSLPMSAETSDSISSAIDRFLRDQLTYDELTAIVSSFVDILQPIERLRTILDTTPEPIASPPLEEQSDKTRRHSRAWSSYEDQRLLAGIYRHGIENWTAISKFVGNNRTRSQCSQRWYRGLNPNIRKDHWSPDEERRLVYLVAQHGDKSWTNIAMLLGNRSDVQCRYRYRQLIKERWSEEEKFRQAQALMYPPPVMYPPMPYGMFHPVQFVSPMPQPIPVQMQPSPMQSPLFVQGQPPGTPFVMGQSPFAIAQSPVFVQGQAGGSPFVMGQSPVFVQGQAGGSPFVMGQSPLFVPGQRAVDGSEHLEQVVFTGTHAISAPAFDGRLYSVY